MIQNSQSVSIIIPVYRSENIVGETVEALLEVFKINHLNAEIVLVNDGSPDNSWTVISALAKAHEQVVAINFFKNYGQHTAVYCGIAESKGDLIITMDDDMQNPPAEIIKLIDAMKDGENDLVFARFKHKEHAEYRRLGTRLVGYLNAKIFGKPKDIKLTNFRIFTRDLANRMLNFRTNYPYIPGLLLMHARSIGNTETEHHPRKDGKSNYTMIRIARLMARILFNYSSFPLRVVSGTGIVISILSFIAGLYFIIHGILKGSSVQGWTTIVVLLSFLCGFILVVLGIMGEYIARMMNQMAQNKPYQILERVD